jgi:hypothetical protein
VISPFFDSTRRRVAPVLAALLVVLSVLVPLLDRGEAVGRAALESEHDAATCVRGHDHTVCAQFGANHTIPGDPPRHGTVSHEAVSLRRLTDHGVVTTAPHTLRQPRAPPLA